MKIIYDTEKDYHNRLTVVPEKGESFPIPCFKIELDDGSLVHSRSRWGNQKVRKSIIEKWKGES